MPIPELLAPAGNSAMLHAAVSAGADAVYLGMGEFNARRNADNFDRRTFREACKYAHLRARRVYVTMNTIILPGEVDGALACVQECHDAGADAFIVQDIGLALAIAQCVPEATLHASTQMNTHSACGVAACAELGFSRVTLARELSVEEIAHLCDVATSFGMEVETFVHGALCVCYSGQCLMSSMIGGRSANRGLCAQACRLPYKLRDMRDPSRELKSPGEFLLSPKDICGFDRLDELASAGVASLKIEGRMKSPEYVHTVVGVYREALDRLAAKSQSHAGSGACKGDGDANDGFQEEARTRLGSVFSRGFTHAYFEGKRGNEIMSYQRPNNRGQFVGRVKSVCDGQVVIAAEKRLSEGDLLEAWTGRGNVRFEVSDAKATGKKGLSVAVEDAGGIRSGDRIFRIRSADAAFVDDDKEPRIPVNGKAMLRMGEPLRIEFATQDGCWAFAEGDVVEAARTKAVTADEVSRHIDRLGQTPFVLHGLDVRLDEGVGIGFSQIHHVRAVALENLEQEILRSFCEEREGDSASGFAGRRHDGGASGPLLFSQADSAVACDMSGPTMPQPVVPQPSGSSQPASLCVMAANPDCARAARRNGAQAIYVPALNYRRGQSQMAGVLSGEISQSGFPKHCVLAIPSIEHDAIGDSREAKLESDAWVNVSSGQRVLADSLAAVLHASGEGCPVEVGPSLPVVNAHAVEVVQALGADCVWLSPELNLQQIKQLVKTARDGGSSVRFGIKVAGAQELMVTEHCMLMSQGDCRQNCPECSRRRVPHALEDRKGYMFPTVTDALGRSHVYNSVNLDNVPAIPELLDAGVTSFMLDATLLNPEETAQATGRIAKAIGAADGEKPLSKMPNTTSGHLFRGVK